MGETSKTVNHAIRILKCFSRSKPILSGSEVAEILGLPRTNVLRLLATLEHAGFVEREESGSRFRIGIGAFEIGSLFLEGNPQLSILTKTLDGLVEKTQCTVYLGVLDHDDIVILTYREGTLPVRFIWKDGDRLPCTTTAVGKAILMHLSDDEITQHLGSDMTLRGLTDRSLRHRRQLEEELTKFRELGWTEVHEESHSGISAVGSAIVNASGKPVAAISICYFDFPPDKGRRIEYANLVVEAARMASEQISKFDVYGKKLTRERIV